MIDYHQLPLVLTSDVTLTYKEIRKLAKENSTVLRIEEDANLKLSVVGIKGNSNFFYKIQNPTLKSVGNKKQVCYDISFSPRSTLSISVHKEEALREATINKLKNWISLLIKYNEINIHPHDNLENQYENEFYEDWFQIVDEDAETNTYDTTRQILISNIITKSIITLKDGGLSEDDEVIQQAEKLKNNITNLTKRQIFDSIKSLYAKVKLKDKGLEKLNDIYKVCETEVIKMGYHFGTKLIGEKLVALIDAIN
ncbi:hypothetical protein [Zobellia nedashkovskayae]|uniref:hypothetical protein n=1 Tax=Zobellia nedashkovskayae TaxID=2779510 RepID=UPI00188D213F|nr:hypothetical protein [Zobellia nedashkovskayae]